MSRLSIIGAGAWGTALAIQAARSGTQVTLWARDPERARMLRKTRNNPRLPGRTLPDPVDVTAELPQTDEPKLLAVPMQHLREVAARLPPSPLVCCAKGIETATLRLPLEILAELHPGASAAVLTGPNFAGEIAAGLPAAAVIAASDAALREQITALLATPTFRLYGNDDPIGAQVGGAAKNVIAIAAGAVMGAGIGENARAGTHHAWTGGAGTVCGRPRRPRRDSNGSIRPGRSRPQLYQRNQPQLRLRLCARTR